LFFNSCGAVDVVEAVVVGCDDVNDVVVVVGVDVVCCVVAVDVVVGVVDIVYAHDDADLLQFNGS
jgi:hypothetical protein